MTRTCRSCGEAIAPARLVALPHTRVCVGCSSEQPVKGFMSWEHKTAPTFQLVSAAADAWLQAHSHRKGPHATLPMDSRSAS